jgi:hypothetical protein
LARQAPKQNTATHVSLPSKLSGNLLTKEVAPQRVSQEIGAADDLSATLWLIRNTSIYSGFVVSEPSCGKSVN